jgi:dTDP-4-dehydrorhamnose reductase
MKFLLLGAAGQVGYELHRALSPLGRVVPACRDGRLPGGGAARVADLSDPSALHALLNAEKPDAIVNAAAYTGVDRAESEAELAHAINATAPGVLAEWCHVHGTRLLHYSTDYVFDGQGTRPWREQDGTAPLGVYGHSKRAGEAAVAESGAEYLILRTAWVYAARGQNFLRTMLRLAAERDHLRVVDDQIGAPTPARWIATATAAIFAEVKAGKPWRNGIVHVSAAGQTSWHGFAQTIFATAQAAGLLERLPTLDAIASSDYPTPAQRPAFSCLDNTRLHDWFGLTLPDWREGVAQVMGELAP